MCRKIYYSFAGTKCHRHLEVYFSQILLSLQGGRGPAGKDGPQGLAATKGEQGEPGSRGQSGSAGPAGDRGLPGQQGPSGLPGLPVGNFAIFLVYGYSYIVLNDLQRNY